MNAFSNMSKRSHFDYSGYCIHIKTAFILNQLNVYRILNINFLLPLLFIFQVEAQGHTILSWPQL